MKTIQIGNIDPQRHVIVDRDIWELSIAALKKAKQFIATTDNYNDGGEPSNRLMQEIEIAISLAERK